MILRDLEYPDIDPIHALVLEEWGEKVADRMIKEVCETCKESDFKPHYYVIENRGLIGAFAGFAPSHILNGVYDLNGIVVGKPYRKMGFGTLLTHARINEIKQREGTLIHLMTKQFRFFDKFGFRIDAWHSGWCHMSKTLGKVDIA